jgi:hypothetical protein
LICKISNNAIISFQMGLSAELHNRIMKLEFLYLKNILYRDGVEIPEEIIVNM